MSVGYRDPVYDLLIRDRNREFIVKVDVEGVEYGMDTLLDFSVENSLSLSDELELGTVIPNKLTIRFRMHSQFPPNAKIVPYIALKTDVITWGSADMSWEEADFPWGGGHTEWMPLGVFYVDRRSKDRDIWTYTCYDRLVFADVEYVSGLTYPTTMQAVWDEICELIGFTYDDSVQIDPSYMINAGPAGYSCRQVMGFIASANSACVYMNRYRYGELSFKRISANSQPAFEMSESDYIRAKQTNPLKRYSRVVVVYDQDDGLYYEAGSGSEAETLYIDNPFGTQEMADKILAEINGLAYTPVSMPAIGYPHLEQGDVINFETTESLAWGEADIPWGEADFPWNGVETYQTIILHQVLDYRGGLAMQIEAPSISEQESEFEIDGTLTAAIKRLNQNAVRYGKPYYGVTHSRTEGIVVQREDGSAKAVFNADELAFYQGGQRRLYFDTINNQYVFDGHLQAASGTFTGELQAASGTFTGELQGGSITIGSGNNVFRADTQGIWAGHSSWTDAPFYVNMQGQLTAVNANVSGTITAISGRIGGWQIKDNVLTSSLSSYPRVELNPDSNEMTFYANPLSFVRIGSINLSSSWNQPYLLLQNGLDYVELENGPLYATISGNRQIRFNFPQIYLDDIVYVDFYDLRDEMTGDSIGLVLLELENEVNKKLDASDGLTTIEDVSDGTFTSKWYFVDGQLVAIV